MGREHVPTCETVSDGRRFRTGVGESRPLARAIDGYTRPVSLENVVGGSGHREICDWYKSKIKQK